MPSFQDAFTETDGKPISYQGKTLHMVDHFPTEGAKTLQLAFETCNSEWRQGVALRVDGKFRVNGQTISKHIVVWQDTAPQTVELMLIGKAPSVAVNNVWDIGNGVTEAWHNGAAMIIEPVANGRRYRCNDGFADDDFDDVVFRLERVT